MRAAVVGACALALAGNASAAYAPRLAVQQSAGTTTISLSIPSTDDPSAMLTFFAPAGTGAVLTATPGSTIGTLTARAAVHGGLIAALTGTVQTRAAAAGTDCTGAGAHAAYWALVFTGFEVPVFVDPVPSALPYAPLVSYSLTVCLPPPSPTAAPIFELGLTLTNVLSAPAVGDNLWRLLATPVNSQAGPVEAQSFVETASITLATPTRALTPASATFRASGTVEVNGLSDTTASLSLARGATATRLAAFAHPAAQPTGAYAQRFAVRRAPRRTQTLFLKATATAPPRDLVETACKPTFDVPCIGATAGGFTATSPLRKLVVPRRP